MSNKALHDRHWEQILGLVYDANFDPDDPPTAGDLIKCVAGAGQVLVCVSLLGKCWPA